MFSCGYKHKILLENEIHCELFVNHTLSPSPIDTADTVELSAQCFVNHTFILHLTKLTNNGRSITQLRALIWEAKFNLPLLFYNSSYRSFGYVGNAVILFIYFFIEVCWNKKKCFSTFTANQLSVSLPRHQAC